MTVVLLVLGQATKGKGCLEWPHPRPRCHVQEEGGREGREGEKESEAVSVEYGL